jgi:hypothetical protein
VADLLDLRVATLQLQGAAAQEPLVLPQLAGVAGRDQKPGQEARPRREGAAREREAR